MNALITRFNPFWASRSLRERQMLLVMTVSIAAFVVWFGVAVPLQAWAGAAQLRHAAAVAEQAPLQQVLDAIATQTAASAHAEPLAVDGLVQHARDAGLSAALADTADTADTAAADGAFSLRIDGADPGHLFAWLQQQRERGIHPREVEIIAAESGLDAVLVYREGRP